MQPITAFGLHIWGNLNQTKSLNIPPNTTEKEWDKLMKEHCERGWYINWLSHQGPGGAFGCCQYVDSLAGN